MFAKHSMQLKDAKALVACIWMCSLNVRCMSDHIPSNLTAFNKTRLGKEGEGSSLATSLT
jgi:hypothetical protein